MVNPVDLPMGCVEGVLTLVLATFIPRLWRLSRREPRVQLLAAVWTGQVAMFGVSAAAHLLGLPSWTHWTPILGGVALALVVLIWRGRDIVAGLRTPPPPAGDQVVGGVHVISGRMADGYTPPSASLTPPVEPPSTPGDPSAYTTVIDYPGSDRST